MDAVTNQLAAVDLHYASALNFEIYDTQYFLKHVPFNRVGFFLLQRNSIFMMALHKLFKLVVKLFNVYSVQLSEWWIETPMLNLSNKV